MGAVSTFIAENSLALFNTFLISVTIILSYQSIKFQSRTSIRESLEQLDDVEYSSEKLKPILHKFAFRPLRGHQTIVQLKYYRYSSQPATSSQSGPHLFQGTLYSINRHVESEIPKDEFLQAISRKLSTLDEVSDIWVEDTGIFLQYETGNSVEVRRRTETVLKNLNEWHTTSKERFVETFNVELDSP